MILEPYTSLVCSIIVAYVYRDLRKRRRGFSYPSWPSKVRDFVVFAMNMLPLSLLLLSLVALFALHLLLIARMDQVINPVGFMAPGAPVLMGSYFDFLRGLHSFGRHLFDLCGVAIASLETAVVYLLYRRIEARSQSRSAWLGVVACAIVVYGMALLARANCSADVYGYISSAKYGVTAYSAQPHAPFTGNFAMLNDIDKKAWKVLAPCPYGPLWLALSYEALARATTVWHAVLIERSIGAIGVLICGWAIWRIRGSIGLAILFVLNPMVVFNFVVEAHNDILGLACVLMAAVSYRRPLFGMLWQAAAGVMKLPYLLVGILAAQVQRSILVRLGAFSAAVLITIAISSVFGGADYLHAIFFHVHKNGQQHHVQSETAHIVLLCICIAALVFAVFRREYYKEAAPAFLALAATIYPWYIALAVPYIIIGDIAPVAYLATLPMSSLFIDVLLGTKFVKVLLIGIVVVSMYFIRAPQKTHMRDV